ncbi:MAG: flavodoxin domain-containing protein, partial [Proteobacteria bacterium]|nr:flavodoxin domain-containing protein [Pseudomonadota bacterium]
MTVAGEASLDLIPLSREKARLAVDLAQGLDSYALQWLAGFMAGAAARSQPAASASAQVPASPVVSSDAGLRLTILYGSQGGNAKRVAERLASQAQSAGLAVRLVRADAYRTGELKKERLLYIVISTHSQGDAVQPPDDARGFFDFLTSKRAPELAQLAYGVLALGDSSYVDFCGIGRRIDERLQQLGAKPLLARAEADVDIATVAEPWAQQALQHARQRLATSEATPAPASGTDVVARLRPTHGAWSRERPFHAELLLNQRIVGSASAKDVRHIELSLQGSGLRYQPGDALGVWPTQSPESVDRVLRTLALDGATPVAHAGETLPLRQWLAERRELTLLTRPFVAAHAERGQHAALQAMLSAQNVGDLSKFLADHQLIDLLRAYPTAWDAQALVAALRALAPRMYSIASSQA